MNNIFIENDTYIMWTGRKFNKGWLNPRDEMGRFTSTQRETQRDISAMEADIDWLQTQIKSLEKRIQKLEKATELIW